MLELAVNKDLLERRDQEEFQESLELKVSREPKDQLEAQDLRVEMESQDPREVLVHLELQEIRELKEALALPELLAKRVTVVTKDPLDQLDSPEPLDVQDPKDLL